MSNKNGIWNGLNSTKNGGIFLKRKKQIIVDNKHSLWYYNLRLWRDTEVVITERS